MLGDKEVGEPWAVALKICPMNVILQHASRTRWEGRIARHECKD